MARAEQRERLGAALAVLRREPSGLVDEAGCFGALRDVSGFECAQQTGEPDHRVVLAECLFDPIGEDGRVFEQFQRGQRIRRDVSVELVLEHFGQSGRHARPVRAEGARTAAEHPQGEPSQFGVGEVQAGEQFHRFRGDRVADRRLRLTSSGGQVGEEGQQVQRDVGEEFRVHRRVAQERDGGERGGIDAARVVDVALELVEPVAVEAGRVLEQHPDQLRDRLAGAARPVDVVEFVRCPHQAPSLGTAGMRCAVVRCDVLRCAAGRCGAVRACGRAGPLRPRRAPTRGRRRPRPSRRPRPRPRRRGRPRAPPAPGRPRPRPAGS